MNYVNNMMKIPLLLSLLVFYMAGTGLSGSPSQEAPLRQKNVQERSQQAGLDEARTSLPGIWNGFSVPLIHLEEGKAQRPWFHPPFNEDRLYQWKYEGGRLMQVPCMPKGWGCCSFSPRRAAVDRSELEEALGDTLVVVKTGHPEQSRSGCRFLYRGKTFHSLAEIGENIGFLLIRYVVFSPDCSDREQSLVREKMTEGTRFRTMEEVIGRDLRPEQPVVLMEGFQVPVSFFVEWKPKPRYQAQD